MAWEYETFGPDGQCKLFGVNIFGDRVYQADDLTLRRILCNMQRVQVRIGIERQCGNLKKASCV